MISISALSNIVITHNVTPRIGRSKKIYQNMYHICFDN